MNCSEFWHSSPAWLRASQSSWRLVSLKAANYTAFASAGVPDWGRLRSAVGVVR